MTVDKLIRSLSNHGIPGSWPVVLQTPDGYQEIKRFSRREIIVEGESEDTVIQVLVIGN